MKSRRFGFGFLLLVLGLGWTSETRAGWRQRYLQYAQYSQRNAAARPAASRPGTNHPAPNQATGTQDQPQQFRQLPIGTEFHYVADRDRKLFPYKKVTATHAQPLASGGHTNAALVLVPGESMVLPRKDTPAKESAAPKPANNTNGHPAKAGKRL
jgi:hypothetical protein